MMDVEAATSQNTKDIHALTVSVTQVVEVVKAAEKRYERDEIDRREMLMEIRKLGEAVNSTRVVEKELAELKGEVGKYRHDLQNLISAQQAIPIFKDELASVKAKMEAVEKAIDTTDLVQLKSDVTTLKSQRDAVKGGVATVGKGAVIFWTIFGSLITSGIGALAVLAVMTYIKMKGEISGY